MNGQRLKLLIKAPEVIKKAKAFATAKSAIKKIL